MTDTKDLSSVLTDIDKTDALVDDHESLESIYKDDQEDRDVPDDDEVDDPDDDAAWEARWNPR